MNYKLVFKVEDKYLFKWIEVLKVAIEKELKHTIEWYDWMVIEEIPFDQLTRFIQG